MKVTNAETEWVPVYEEVTVRLCTGDAALTADEAKDFLMWEEEGENENFGKHYLLKNTSKKKVRCHANVTNRPLNHKNMQSLKQDILNGRWRFNGEPIIIGKTGKILNGQHQMIALILATEEWEADEHDGPEPSIDKLIVFGVEEDDAVVNTMDTCRPRSLSEVIYRSEYFKDRNTKERKQISRITAFAVNTLWERLGDSKAFSPRQTHAEVLTFLDNHPTLLSAVDFVYTEDNDKSLRELLSLGTMAGMFYLMASSASDSNKYFLEPTEASLNFDNWKRATQFYQAISSRDSSTKPLILAFKKLIENRGNRREKLATLNLCWLQWVERGRTYKVPKLSYVEDGGVQVLAGDYSVGGIDLLEPV